MITTPPSPAPRHARRALLLRAAAACIALVLGGCASAGYYAQAVSGQFELWRKRAPIASVIADPVTPQETRRKLALVQDARAFAASRLALPADGSYAHYVELGREYVVWNVYAAPPLALEPEASCFLFVGCLDYRGYFARADAEAHAAAQEAAGLDVYLAGVAAYSTLGWFDDPVLSSMLAYDDARLVEILFHELAHRRFYLPDATDFNESFAMAVAEAGLALWQATRGETAQGTLARAAREAALTDLVLETRAELATVYAGEASASEKLAAKRAAFERLRRRYEQMKSTWDGDTRFDRWMYAPWNNARLASVATYHAHVPAFRALLARSGGGFAAFYRQVESLAALDAAQRVACLAAYAEARFDAPCPDPAAGDHAP